MPTKKHRTTGATLDPFQKADLEERERGAKTTGGKAKVRLQRLQITQRILGEKVTGKGAKKR